MLATCELACLSAVLEIGEVDAKGPGRPARRSQFRELA